MKGPRSQFALKIVLALSVPVLCGAVWALWRGSPSGTVSSILAIGPGGPGYEQWARERFHIEHPGEKPLNWPIARAAKEFHETRPMGKFELAVKPGQWGNDCSDFVECAIDEGLGVKARFKRESRTHLLARDQRLWDSSVWRPGDVTQPGDIIQVRHSPWYEPYEGACWHVGIIGSDGKVYDYTKLKRWREARYGRSEFDWFVRHSTEPGDVIVGRLAPEYRYMAKPLPKPRVTEDEVGQRAGR